MPGPVLGPGVHTDRVSVAVTTTTDGLPAGTPGGLAEGLAGAVADEADGGETAGVLGFTDGDAEDAHWSAARVTWTQPVTSLGGGLV